MSGRFKTIVRISCVETTDDHRDERRVLSTDDGRQPTPSLHLTVPGNRTSSVQQVIEDVIRAAETDGSIRSAGIRGGEEMAYHLIPRMHVVDLLHHRPGLEEAHADGNLREIDGST